MSAVVTQQRLTVEIPIHTLSCQKKTRVATEQLLVRNRIEQTITLFHRGVNALQRLQWFGEANLVIHLWTAILNTAAE